MSMTNSDEIQNEDEFDQDDQLEGNVQIPSRDMKALRAQAKKAGEAEKALASAQRELAFARAKIDLEDPRMNYFIKGYEGELTADAIRAEAEKAGFLNNPGGSGGYSPPNVDRGSIERIRDAGQGAGTSGDHTNLEEAIRNAKSQDEVMTIMTKAGFPTPYNRPSDY